MKRQSITCPEPNKCADIKSCIDQVCKKKIMPSGESLPTCKDMKNINNRSNFIKDISFWCNHVQANKIYNELENCICNPNNNNSGLSGGAIAGIVVGSVVGLALIIFLIYKFKRK